jgi:voltage-gated potassium channel
LLQAISEKYPELLDELLVVDFNLEVLKELQGMHIHGIFGDISHIDTLAHAHIEKAQIIISTIPDVLLKGINNYELVKMCRTIAPQAAIVATADLADHVEALKRVGASEVLLPYSMAGEYLADYIGKTIEEPPDPEWAYVS